MGLAMLREEAGDWEEAERLACHAIDANPEKWYALTRLMRAREEAGDRQTAERLAWYRVDATGDVATLRVLAHLRQRLVPGRMRSGCSVPPSPEPEPETSTSCGTWLRCIRRLGSGRRPSG